MFPCTTLFHFCTTYWTWSSSRPPLIYQQTFTHRHSDIVIDLLHIWMPCIIDENMIYHASPPLCTSSWYQTGWSLHLWTFLRMVSKLIRFDLSFRFPQGWRLDYNNAPFAGVGQDPYMCVPVMRPETHWKMTRRTFPEVKLTVPKYTLPIPWNQYSCTNHSVSLERRHHRVTAPNAGNRLFHPSFHSSFPFIWSQSLILDD